MLLFCAAPTWDITLALGAPFPAPGSWTPARREYENPGGRELTAASAAAALGHPVTLACELAGDAEGRALAQILPRQQALTLLDTPAPVGARTRINMVLVDDTGERTIISRLRDSRPRLAPIAGALQDAYRRAAFVVPNTLAPAAQLRPCARAAQGRLALDPSQWETELGAHCTVFIGSAADYARDGHSTPPDAQLRARGTRLFVLSDSARGGRYWHAGRWHRYAPAPAGAVIDADPTATGLLGAVCGASALTLAPAAWAARKVLCAGAREGVLAAARRSLPLGLLALASIAYYRCGIILLGALSSSSQTAMFAASSTVAFALLMAPNAISAGLLPKLAASAREHHAGLVRRATLAGFGACGALALGVCALARPLLTCLFGASYAAGAGPLRALALATVLIGPAGILGTALIAAGRLRAIYAQVAVSVAANLLITALSARALGADGAALGTVVCEAIAALMLTVAAARALPGLLPALTAPRRQRALEKPLPRAAPEPNTTPADAQPPEDDKDEDIPLF